MVDKPISLQLTFLNPPQSFYRGLGGLLFFLCLTAGSPLRAQPGAEGKDGMFITVPSPITDNIVTTIEQKVKDAFDRQKRRIETIVFDFTPDGQPAASTKAGACIELKSYIQRLELGQVNPIYPPIATVAFVHGKVRRNTVLPVLACSQLVMSNDATLGDVLGGDVILTREVKAAYDALASQRNTGALIYKMLDGNLLLHQVKTRQGQAFITDEELQKRKARGESITILNSGLEMDPGQSTFTAEQARKFGLCQALYETPRQVAQALNLPASSLRENWLVGRTTVPWVIDLRGEVNAGNLESVKRRIGNAIRRGANMIILRLDCEGGNVADATAFVEYLRTRKDRSEHLPVKIIAYIPPDRKLGAATYLALACSEIVMGRNAVLGDFENLKDRGPEDLKIKREILVKLAESHNYPGLLFQATLDPGLVLYRVQGKKDPAKIRLISQDDFEKDQASKNPRWLKISQIMKNNPPFLTIGPDLAREWGIASHTDVNTNRELFDKYNLEPESVKVSQDDFLDDVAEFFRNPIVNIFLILIAIAGLILELKMPGIGLPGVLSALCFVLFFWAHSFVGQFAMLAVLLFILGMVLLAVEIFVIPGFGITGISGILLIIFSLILVTLEKAPETPQDWENIGWTVGSFSISFLGAIAVAVAIASFLPQIPYANRLMLLPPGERDEGEDSEMSSISSTQAALLGAIGIAETPLRPAGKARFGDDYLDVVSEGEYINPGTRVQVVEIEGNRIVVKQV